MSQVERGRLKVFLGYAAGVGKTYKMLSAARTRQLEGVDVLVALALTHGRKETEVLLEGLDILPTVTIRYKGVELSEVDVDGVLNRKPQLVLVDELAHTNIPGSRHIKRFQDVEEILAAGIDVYTTLNIQHLESYQDSIEQLTGVPVRERVPDSILDEADEIELVDLPPEELLERLAQGKVYIPEQAQRAIYKFFRKENLQFLREVALRKTAAIVDLGRTTVHGISKLSVSPKLLAAVGPSPFSERVIRVTKRLADMLKAEWYVISIETSDLVILPEGERQRLQAHLHLAEQLGAKIAVLPGESVSDTIGEYARTHGVTQIIVGYSMIPFYKRLWRRSPVDDLVKNKFGIDVYVVSSWKEEHHLLPEPKRRRFPPFSSFLIPFGSVVGLTIVLAPFADYLKPNSVAVIYLFSSAVAALIFPPLSFYLYVFMAIFLLDLVYITDLEEWLMQAEPFLFSFATFCIGTVINQLMSRYRRLNRAAVLRHRETLTLFELSRDLVSVSEPAEMLTLVNQHLAALLPAEAVLYLKDKRIGKSPPLFDENEQMAAHWATSHLEPAGRETNTLPAAKGLWIPLSVAEKHLGALGLYPIEENNSLLAHQSLLQAFAHVLALSLDRA